MPFNVGDRVRVKSEEEIRALCIPDGDGFRASDGRPGYFNPRMFRYCGRVSVVRSVSFDYCHIEGFTDRIDWSWYDWMLEPDDPNEIHVGDRVKMKSKARLMREGNHAGIVSQMSHLYGMEGVVVKIDGNHIELDNPWFRRVSDGRSVLFHWAVLKSQFIKLPQEDDYGEV